MLDVPDTMGLLRCRSSARILHWRVELLFMVVLILQLSLAYGQKPVMFEYGNISTRYGIDGTKQRGMYGNLQVPAQWTSYAEIKELGVENITCLGDFHDQGSTELFLVAQMNRLDPIGGDVSGRCLYKDPVQLMEPGGCSSWDSFGTMFEVMMSPVNNGQQGLLQGLAFIIASDNSSQGAGGGYLGWLNSTTNGQASPGHNFAVEIDFIRDLQFQDPVYAHVGVDNNSLISVNTSIINASWTDSHTFTVWIDYDVSSKSLDVFIGDFYKKPTLPTMSTKIDLTQALSQGAFVGFAGSISNVSSSSSSTGYEILSWTFNSNGPAPDLERNADGTLRARTRAPNRFIIVRDVLMAYASFPYVMALLFLVFIIYKLCRRIARLTAFARKYDIDMSMLDHGPQSFEYNALRTATKGFSPDQLLGTGGFGSVYMGKVVLKGDKKPTEIAVKRISDTSNQGASEFLAEVKIIGQAQHRNLVRLLGWCYDTNELLLVYDYMPNGSVDQHLYRNTPGEPTVLTWARRLKIVSGVATALAFLHDEWEQRVIHRDVKSSNIMLDHDFNARLGDFGLARSSDHDKSVLCTPVAGTRGYLAPELGVTFQPTEKTDVYSFGALMLELATGKKPMLSREDKKSLKEIFLVDWVWGLYRDDVLLDIAADCALKNAYDPREMIMFLKIGLLCCHPNPDERPTMRDVINMWKGSSLLPPLPRSKPVPVFPVNPDGLAPLDYSWDDTTAISQADVSWTGTFPLDCDGHTALTISSDDYAYSSPSQKPRVGKDGSADPMLRHRPRTTTSLPF